MAASPRILLLPGWQNSGPGHWQSLWEARHGYHRVEQHDWMRPLRGDWSARLEETVADADGPVVLAAHSLGCLLVSAWAAHSRHTLKVAGALLVAPPDTERDDMPPQLHGWRPLTRQPLPFPAIAVISRDDPYGDAGRMAALARAWGAELVDAGPRGHLNHESGLGDWPDGRALLLHLARRAGNAGASAG